MPELPEVDTIVRGLRDYVIGKSISHIEELRDNTVEVHTPDDSCNNCTITDIKRRGKYIIFELSNENTIVIHLRMTGKLVYVSDERITPYTRAIIRFSDKTSLQFEDIRTFGSIKIFPKDMTDPSILKLGPEPLSSEFNESYLKDSLKKLKAPIKNILLRQDIVAGLGNIYVCELLYRAKISPLKAGNTLTNSELKRVIEYTKEVISEALLHNGTSVSDFRNVDDKPGSFQNFLRVYQKKVCPLGHKVQRIKQAGRSTFYCDKCQK